MKLIWLVILALFAPALAQEAHGPWEVRRGRSTDADVAGGWPTWQVLFDGPDATPDVAITEDDGKGRGTVLVGRRLTVDRDAPVTLAFEFTTACAMDARRGRLELVVLDPEAWDALGQEPQTPVVFDVRNPQRVLASIEVVSLVGDDIAEPVELELGPRTALAHQLQRFAGREVVVAVAWTALHGGVETATLRGLEVVTVEPRDIVRALFDRIDLERAELAQAKAAVAAGDAPAAAAAVAAAIAARTEPRLPGDLRDREPGSFGERRLNEANEALAGRFVGQPMYGFQQVPEAIDWSFNPGKDPEWTWQFNRHSAWRALAEAYRATGDETYAERWVELMRDWVTENPPGTPWSWRTIEAGIRGQGWPYVYTAFIDSPSVTPQDHLLFLNALADHADYLMPSGRYHPESNWGQIESLGLLHLGSFFPEFRDAATWRDTAWRRIEEMALGQVLEDGAQIELTTSYHQGVMSGFLEAAEIARLGGAEPSDEYWSRVEKMYEYLMVLTKPDGTVPMLGDSWPSNVTGHLRNGARRFERPDLLYVGTGGKEGEPPASLDMALPKAGYYVMRTDWADPQAVWLFTDIAHRWGGGHQQPDALQVILYAYGRTLNPDAGSYLYYGPDRARFARTASHSTVTVDDANQNTSAARLNAFARNGALSFVDGEQDGYEGVTHRRQVLFARPTDDAPPYAVVIDRLSGEGEHTLDQSWHFLPAPLETDGLAAWTALPEGPGLLTRALPRPGMVMEPVESEVSFRYTEKEPRPAVRYRQTGALPATFVTLLLPYPGATPPRVAFEALDAPGDTVAVRVRGDGWEDRLFAAGEAATVELDGRTLTGRAGRVRVGGEATVIPAEE